MPIKITTDTIKNPRLHPLASKSRLSTLGVGAVDHGTERHGMGLRGCWRRSDVSGFGAMTYGAELSAKDLSTNISNILLVAAFRCIRKGK
jgi:hypothetical protein